MADAAISHDGKRQSTGEEQVAKKLKRGESDEERAKEALRKFHAMFAAAYKAELEGPLPPPLGDETGSDEDEVEVGHDYVAGEDEVEVTGSAEVEVGHDYVAGEDEDEGEYEVEAGEDEDETKEFKGFEGIDESFKIMNKEDEERNSFL